MLFNPVKLDGPPKVREWLSTHAQLVSSLMRCMTCESIKLKSIFCESLFPSTPAMTEPESHVDPVVAPATPSMLQLSEEDRSAIAAEVAQLLQPALGSAAASIRPAPGRLPTPSTSTSTSGKKVHCKSSHRSCHKNPAVELHVTACLTHAQ